MTTTPEDLSAEHQLRSDVERYRKMRRRAQEDLKIAEAVLPGLEEALDAIVGEAADTESHGPLPEPDRAAAGDAGEAATVTAHTPSVFYGGGEAVFNFTGKAPEQVEQALRWKSPQNVEDLKKILNYSRGAIRYGFRALAMQGKIRKAHKSGNLQFYELVTDEK